MSTHNQRHSCNSSEAIALTSPGRDYSSPFRLGGVFIFGLLLVLTSCVLPSEDISHRQQISGTAIRAAIQDAIFCEDVRLLNNRYIAYAQFEVIECLDSGAWIAEMEYIPELYDCEKFALNTMAWVGAHLRGVPFGFAIRETETAHAENIFVDEALNVWVVDIKRHGSKLIAAHAFYFLVMI